MPPSITSKWQQCDKISDPTSPACSCPCNSELVTITQYYPGHQKCIDPSMEQAATSNAAPTVATNNDNFYCPNNFESVGSSGISCIETPLIEVVPVEGTSVLAIATKLNDQTDPEKLLRCDCFTKCMMHAGCHHVIFVGGNVPNCQLYGETCTVAVASDLTNIPHPAGLHATLFRKYNAAASSNTVSSSLACKTLGWALTDTKIPQVTCASAGVCDKDTHANVLPGGRCRRRCSGDVTFQVAQEFCQVLGARLCSPDEMMTMDQNTDARSCGGDFKILSDTPAWSSKKCVAQDYILKKSGAKCSEDPRSDQPDQNKIPFGATSTIFECVRHCARNHDIVSGIHKGCRYIGYDGTQCWMIQTISMETCLSVEAGTFQVDASNGKGPEHSFSDRSGLADPLHTNVKLYEVFSEGQNIISMDRGSKQFRESCLATTSTAANDDLSEKNTNKAYAFCCADRWPLTLSIFAAKSASFASSSIVDGTSKPHMVSNTGAAGVWSSNKQTRLKPTSPVSKNPNPKFAIDFLDGTATMTPAVYQEKDLTMSPIDNFGDGVIGYSGGMTAINILEETGINFYLDGNNGFDIGNEWTVEVYVRAPTVAYWNIHSANNSPSTKWVLLSNKAGDHGLYFHTEDTNGVVGTYDTSGGTGFHPFVPQILNNEVMINEWTWKRLNLVVKAGKTKLYIDGTFKGEASFAISTNIYSVGGKEPHFENGLTTSEFMGCYTNSDLDGRPSLDDRVDTTSVEQCGLLRSGQEFVALEHGGQCWNNWGLRHKDGRDKLADNQCQSGGGGREGKDETGKRMGSNNIVAVYRVSVNPTWGILSKFQFFDKSLTTKQIADRTACVDTDSWNNGDDKTCTNYNADYCSGGEFSVASTHMAGSNFNFPEDNCCSCGKEATTTQDSTGTFPEIEFPNILREGDNIFPIHGPFTMAESIETVTMSALPRHSHLHISGIYYDTRMTDSRISNVCVVTVEFTRFGVTYSNTYSGSERPNGVPSVLNLVDVGSMSAPQFSYIDTEDGTCTTFSKTGTSISNIFSTATYSPWEKEQAQQYVSSLTSGSPLTFYNAPCANNIQINQYRQCNINVLVPHNETVVTLKFGPTSSVGRTTSDLWAIGDLNVQGRMVPISRTSRNALVGTEYTNLYTDSQQWSTEHFGTTCVTSSCPDVLGNLCAPTIHGFCDGSHYDCLKRSKQWCLDTEAGQPFPLCSGIAHTNTDTYVKLCIPSVLTGVIQTVDESNSVTVKRYSSVKPSSSSTYLGCFVNQPGHFNYGPQASGYTPVSCSVACTNADYKYFALKNNGFCACDNTPGTTVNGGVADSECGINKMGSNSRNAVYGTEPDQAKFSGLHNWKGNLMGRHATVTVSGNGGMTPSYPVTLDIPCDSGEVIVRKIAGTPLIITKIIYQEDDAGNSASSSYQGTIDVQPNQLYSVKYQILRSDLGSANEYVGGIGIDGINIGSCNPPGTDYDCDFFECTSQYQGTISSNSGTLNIDVDMTGNSKYCDCDRSDINGKCVREDTTFAAIPIGNFVDYSYDVTNSKGTASTIPNTVFLPQDWTFAAAITPSSLTGSQTILMRGRSGCSSGPWYITMTYGHIRVTVPHEPTLASQSNTLWASETLTVGTTYQIKIMSRRGTMNFFVDGAQIGSDVTSTPVQTTSTITCNLDGADGGGDIPWMVGAHYWNSARYHDSSNRFGVGPFVGTIRGAIFTEETYIPTKAAIKITLTPSAVLMYSLRHDNCGAEVNKFASCVVEVNKACQVKIRYKDQCIASRGDNAWSAFVGPGQTVTSTDACNVTVSADSIDAAALVVAENSLQPIVDRGWDGCSAANPCPKCAGDCDTDDDCTGDLKCFLRDMGSIVPGCATVGLKATREEEQDYNLLPGLHDYCYDSDDSINEPVRFMMSENSNPYNAYEWATSDTNDQTTALGWAANRGTEENLYAPRQLWCDGVEQIQGSCKTIRGPFRGQPGGGWYSAPKPSRLEAIFSGIPTHRAVRVRLRFIKSGYWWWWRSSEKAWLEIDGIKVYETKLSNEKDVKKYPGTSKYYADIDIEIPHSSTTLIVTMLTSIRDYTDKQLHIENLKIQISNSVVDFPLVTNYFVRPNIQRLIYKDAIMTTANGENGLEQVMGIVKEGWSSPKTLAYRWADTPEQEVSTLVETCTAESNPKLCRVAHGPFGRDEKNSKTFSNLGKHNQVTLSLRFWYADSWDRNEKGFVDLNGENVFSFNNIPWQPCTSEWQLGYYEPWSNSGGRVCFHDIKVTRPHSAESIDVLLYSNIGGYIRDESWGFSDVRLYVSEEAADLGILVMPPKSSVKWATALTTFYTDENADDGTVVTEGWSR